MIQKTMEELQRDQELLREEVNQLKGQMSQVLEILQVLLKREGISSPIATTQVDTPIAFSLATPAREPHHSVITHVPMNGPSPKDLPQPVFLKVSITGESSTGAKKSFRNFQKKKEVEANVVSIERRRPRRRPQYYDQPQVDVVTPTVKAQPIQIPQRQAVEQNQNRNARNRPQFDPIPMTYTALYPHLVELGLITTRPLIPPNPLPTGVRTDLHCEFHQGAAGHDLENCYPLKARVRELVRSKEINFRDPPPNVINNPLPGKSG